MSEPSPKPVRVTIFGEEYVIRSEMGEEYTRECARLVDEAIQDAHLRGHVAEPHKAAILAAMQITDQLLSARSEGEAQRERVAGRLEVLLEGEEDSAPGD